MAIDVYQVLEKPLVTEKSTMMQEHGNRVMFQVRREANKLQIKEAVQKIFKVTVLDAESSLSGGHLSSGLESDIVGIVPPERYPRSTWDHLVRQERLADAGRGTYELGPKA